MAKNQMPTHYTGRKANNSGISPTCREESVSVHFFKGTRMHEKCIEDLTAVELINNIVDLLESSGRLCFPKRTHANILLSESTDTLRKMYGKLVIDLATNGPFNEPY